MKHKSAKMVMSLIISLLLVLEIIPMNVFAALNTENMNVNVSENKNDEVPNVVAEVVEERDEFSKVYLLEDGSYYSVTTYAPIHEKVNGKWESIDESIDEFTDDVSDVEKALQTASIEFYQTSSEIALMSDGPIVNDESSLIVNCIGAQLNADGNTVNFNSKATILVKPQNLYYYLNNNKLVVEAKLSVDCAVSSSTHKDSDIKLYESSMQWDENTTNFPVGYNISNEKLIDYNIINAAGIYYWDITDLYNRWDREATDNNGFLLHSTHPKCSLVLSSMFISVRYKNVDEKDLDSTYHTVDMGRAGTVSINDITHTVKVDQDILKIDRALMPISLKRIYNLSESYMAKSAGMGFRWNYESHISFDGEVVSWKMFDGTVMHYKKSEETNGEYIKYTEIGKAAAYSTDDSVAWVKSSELSKVEYDYRNFYIEVNAEKYTFDISGNLIKLQIGEEELNSVNFNYSNGCLSSIAYSDASNLITTISFNFPSSGSGYVHFATFQEGDANNSYQQIVRFTTSTNETTGEVTNVITYSDNQQVSYRFSSNGELLEIVNADGTKMKFYYFNETNGIKGNRLVKYEKFTISDSQEVLIDSLQFDINNTYQRLIIDKEQNEEFMQYDTRYNLVTHKSFNGNYTFVTYDENNVINSFTVEENNTTELLENAGFEERDAIGEQIAWNSMGNLIAFGIINNIQVCPGEGNNNTIAKFEAYKAFSESLYQDVAGLEVDQTYVFGAWIYIDEALPSSKRDVTLNIKNAYDEEEILATIEYDTTAPKQWQYRMGAFKLYDDIEVQLTVDYDGQAGTIYVDNLTLYKSSIAQSDIEDLVSESPYITTRNDDGLVESETLSNGTSSLTKSYSYDNNRISSVTDINGVTTYYEYDNNTGYLKAIGTIKSGDIIVNPTEFSYTTNGLRNRIQQMVTDIRTNETINMETLYSYNGDQIESVTHNGFSYKFDYDVNGNLERVDIVNGGSAEASEERMIEYTYDDNGIGEINYSNGLTLKYTYENNEIKSIEYYLNTNELIKKIEYSHNADGYLVINDTQSGLIIEYTSDGYKLFKVNSETSKTLLYSMEKGLDGSVTETYMPDLYNRNGENKVVIITEPTTTVQNSETGVITKSSGVNVNKIRDWTDTDPLDAVTYNYYRQSVTDYFGRVTQKSVELQTLNSNGETSKKTEVYSYKEIEAGVTSTLVSSYTTNISLYDDNNEPRIAYSNEVFYEYDHNGNIIFEYVIQNETPVLKKYYEYDEAQQIIGEINFEKAIAVTYAYDVGGNLIVKNYHNYTEASSNITEKFNICYAAGGDYCSVEKGISKYGTIQETVNLGYDDVYKDRLISYDNQLISYDSLGNPTNYVGSTYEALSLGTSLSGSDNVITGSLEWLGNRLSAFETESERYEYEYDDNGYRTRKLIFDKDLVDPNMPGEYEYTLRTETIYIWDNGVLKSVIFDASVEEPLQSDIIYDQEGNMSGFVSYTGASVYFVKDVNGSVKRLVDDEGRTMVSISYDAWGVPSIKIHADPSTVEGFFAYLAYGVLTHINPSAYQGYFYDYDTGLYFSNDRVYSPSWGRFLNPAESSTLLGQCDSIFTSNLYVFCNNNPVNTIEPYSAWANNNYEFEWLSQGFRVDTREAFLSRPLCMIFANQIIMSKGTYSFGNGFSYCGMNTLDIAQSLFAHSTGKFAFSAINKVNSAWGDGWIVNNKNSNSILVIASDPNKWKYTKIWNAASDIRLYALSQGVYITV